MEEVKKLLGEELFNQVSEKLGDKKLIINDGSYIPKQKFDDINNDKKDLQARLEEANTKIESLSKVDTADLQKQIDDWKEKYETDTKELNNKYSKRERSYLINDLTRTLKFSSESARKAFINELTEKDLKIEDGKMLGFDDYVSSYKENDPNAFMPEKKDEGQTLNLGGEHQDPIGDDDSHARSLMGLKTETK